MRGGRWRSSVALGEENLRQEGNLGEEQGNEKLFRYDLNLGQIASALRPTSGRNHKIFATDVNRLYISCKFLRILTE